MRQDADGVYIGVCVFIGIVDDDVGLNGIRKVFYLAAALGTDDRCCSDSHSAALAKFDILIGGGALPMSVPLRRGFGNLQGTGNSMKRGNDEKFTCKLSRGRIQ